VYYWIVGERMKKHLSTGGSVLMVILVLFSGCQETDQPLNSIYTYKGENARFGFLGTYPDYKNEFDYEEMAKLGVGWIRIIWADAAFVWGNIEKTPGVYDFDMQDAFVKEMQKYGFNIFPVIWPYAQWDQQECYNESCLVNEDDVFIDQLGISRCNPCNETAYLNFIRTMVERYDGDGVDDMPGLEYPVTYYEFINEPFLNIEVEEKKEATEMHYKGTPEEFVHFMNMTYDAMKEAYAEVVFVHAGINSLEDDYITLDFWNVVYKQHAKFDVANIHAINQDRYDLFTAELTELLSRYYESMPSFWVGEVEVAGDEDMYDEETQAMDLIKGYVRAFANGAEKIFYNIWYDPGSSQTFMNAAVIRVDHTEKSLYYAFKTMISKIDYFTSVEKREEGLFKFTVNDNAVYVAWNIDALPEDLTGEVKVTEMLGTEHIVDASEIKSTEQPIFIELL
jgi:hypothetical protein